MEAKNNHHFDKPVSATEAARETGIPFGTIKRWIFEGSVKIIDHPGHACTGKPVILDHITLNERIRRYQPRPRRKLATVEA